MKNKAAIKNKIVALLLTASVIALSAAALAQTAATAQPAATGQTAATAQPAPPAATAPALPAEQATQPAQTSQPAAAIPAAQPAQPASSTKYVGVNYAHTEAEYSVTLPEAPSATTIWADDYQSVPYLSNPPSYGAIGEVATFKRMHPATGDFFDAKVTFVKAPQEFLDSLTKETMLATLNEEFPNIQLDQKDVSYSAGSGTLKWATINGISIDKDNNLLFNAAHYLSGMRSIIVIRVTYTIENKNYKEYFDTLTKSIHYIGQ